MINPTCQALTIMVNDLRGLDHTARAGLDHAARLELITLARTAERLVSNLVGVLVAEAEVAGSAKAAAGTPTRTWLTRTGSIGAGEAAGLVRTGEAVTATPAMKRAALAGVVDGRQARAIGKVMNELPAGLTPVQPATAEAFLLDQARVTPADRLSKLRRDALAAATLSDGDDAEDEHARLVARERRARARRGFTWWNDGDGAVGFKGSLPVVEGESLVKLVTAYAEADRRRGRDFRDPLTEQRTPEQRRADALIALVRNHTQATHPARDGSGEGAAHARGRVGTDPSVLGAAQDASFQATGTGGTAHRTDCAGKHTPPDPIHQNSAADGASGDRALDGSNHTLPDGSRLITATQVAGQEAAAANRHLPAPSGGEGCLILTGGAAAVRGSVLVGDPGAATQDGIQDTLIGNPSRMAYPVARHGSRTAPHNDGQGRQTGVAPGVAGDRPRIVVTIREADLRTRAEAAGILETGDQIPTPELRRLCCDADLLPIVLGTHSEILDVGREQRLVTPPIRAAMNLRDGGCIFPGCNVPPAQTDAHHIIPWWQGGDTALHNLASLCAHHHRLVEPPRLNSVHTGPHGQADRSDRDDRWELRPVTPHPGTRGPEPKAHHDPNGDPDPSAHHGTSGDHDPDAHQGPNGGPDPDARPDPGGGPDPSAHPDPGSRFEVIPPARLDPARRPIPCQRGPATLL